MSLSFSSWELRRELRKLVSDSEKIEAFLSFLRGTRDVDSRVLRVMENFERSIGARFPWDRSLHLSDVFMLAWLLGIRPRDPVGQKTLSEILATQGISLDFISNAAREARVKLKILERDKIWI